MAEKAGMRAPSFSLEEALNKSPPGFVQNRDGASLQRRKLRIDRSFLMHPAGISLLAVACVWSPSAGATDLLVRVADDNGAGLANTVVSANPIGAHTSASGPRQGIIDQVNREFVPVVNVVPIGAAVRFPNQDQIRHHVYSFSPAKTFEIPLYSGTPKDDVVFDKPGIVVLGCNIHDWMRAYVFVTEAPYYAVSGGDGTVRLQGLAPGEYQLTLWHARLQGPSSLTRRVTLAGPEMALDFPVDVKREILPRRISLVGSGPGY